MADWERKCFLYCECARHAALLPGKERKGAGSWIFYSPICASKLAPLREYKGFGVSALNFFMPQTNYSEP